MKTQEQVAVLGTASLAAWDDGEPMDIETMREHAELVRLRLACWASGD